MQIKYLVLIFFSLSSYPSLACLCELTPIENHIKESKYIATVEVVELLDTDEERKKYYFSDADKSYRVKVKILTNYKGFRNEEIIELDSEFTNCDIYFEINNHYLLFLYKEGDKYLMQHCSYNEHIKNAKENIRAIEKALKKKD